MRLLEATVTGIVITIRKIMETFGKTFGHTLNIKNVVLNAHTFSGMSQRLDYIKQPYIIPPI
jgi:hypothetical protein